MKGLESAATDLHKVRSRIARLRDSGRLSIESATYLLTKVFSLLEDLERDENDISLKANTC